MRMTRGSGWPALAGMAGVVPETRIVRPLLLTPRAAIERFLTAIREPWTCDAMNDDDVYFRNRVRHRLLPVFLEENPAFLATVAARWRMARADEEFFDAGLSALVPELWENGMFLRRETLLDAPAALRIRKYRELLTALGPGQVTAANLAALENAMQRNEGGKTIQFPGGKRAVIRRGGILFSGGMAGDSF